MFAFPNMERHLAWSIITFFGDSVKGVYDKETNETYFVEVPRLPIKSFYPWNAMSGLPYIATFAFQVTSKILTNGNSQMELCVCVWVFTFL